ncbi:MAG: hypothetical protein HRT89_15490, partial [Lentisphaeria bacterium]|nr:hypothetical protein [Lentisphaeria bacterium]NQZ69460.1 hypothetical protein [Lentisphaeria bacterium]
MIKSRRCLAADGRGELHIIEEPIPELNDNHVLVQVERSLISPGTEIAYGLMNARKSPNPSAPMRKFGYGNAGVVLEVGKGCTHFEPGDRVACMGGTALHSTHVVVPKNLCIAIPGNIDYSQAAFSHLAATGMHCVRRGGVGLGHHVVIAGMGIIGQIASQLSRISGAH